MRRFTGWIGGFFSSQRMPTGNTAEFDYRQRLDGSFYVEHVSEDGEIVQQRVAAYRLTRVDDGLYLHGWCEMLPAFRCLPVARMTQLVDDRTGELIPRGDIEGWLTKRALN